MSCSALVLIASTLPLVQQPETRPDPAIRRDGPTARAPALRDADLLPARTVLAMQVRLGAAQRAELEKTALWGLAFAKPAFASAITAQVELALGQIGLDAATVRRTLAGTITVASPGLDPRGNLEWIVLADTPAVGAALAPERLGKTLAASGGTVRGELAGKLTVLRIQTGTPATFYVASAKGRTALATSQSLLTETLEESEPRPERLTSVGAFAQWSESVGDGDTLVAGWIDLKRVVGMAMQQAPLRLRQGLATTGDALRLHQLASAGWTLVARGGELHDTLRVAFPSPRQGLLAVLAGEPQHIVSGLASLVSAKASSWWITRCDFQLLFQELRYLLATFDKGAGEKLEAELRTQLQQTGVDFEREVVGALSGGVITQLWPAAADQPGQLHTAVLLELRPGNRLAEAFTKLGHGLGLRTSTVTVLGKRVYRMVLPVTGPEVVPLAYIGDHHAVVASSTPAMEQVLGLLAEAPENKPVQELLAKLPSGAVSVSRTDLSSLLAMITERVTAGMFGSGAGAQAAQLPGLEGSMRTLLVNEPDAIVWRSSSPVGNLAGLGALGIAAAVVVPGLLEDGLRGTGRFAKAEGGAEDPIGKLVAQIGDAERLFRMQMRRDTDQDRRGEFGTLGELVRAGLLPADVLGVPVVEEEYQARGYRFTVLLPAANDEREQHFAVVAWPGDQKTGLVWCSTDDARCLRNDLIARTLGIASIDVRDIYVSGTFTGPMTTGWREVKADAEPRRQEAAGQQEKDTLAMLDGLEKQGNKGKTPPELLIALESENATIRARAAYVAGKTLAADASPRLAAIVAREPDGEPRRQAMAALLAFADPRGRQAAIAALASGDESVRGCAAKLLGKLVAKDAVEPLVAMLAASKGQTGSDRVQALIALADIGDPRCLPNATASVREEEAQLSNGLAFLLQSLSPKLPAKDEVRQLMAILDHPALLVRRYAIERLGELRATVATGALEGRLAKEGPSLQPLVQRSLDAIRGSGHMAEVSNPFVSFANKAGATWQRLDETSRYVVLGVAGLMGLALVLCIVLVMRIRRHRAAEAWASRVAPSEEYLAEHAQQSSEELDVYEGASDEGVEVEEPVPAHRTRGGRGGRGW